MVSLGGEGPVSDEWPSRADKVTGPLAPRRAIAEAIKDLREQSGKSVNKVAVELMVSKTNGSRLDNAQGRPLSLDIRDLIPYYEIEGQPLAGRLRRWVMDAQRSGWWTDFDAD